MTTVLGRDPLRYQGVVPVASKLKIDKLSSDHLALWSSGGVLYVRDLGSANGTFLDGVRLQAYAVYPVTKGQRLELSAVVDGLAE
jgi:pSer/pThr/pTyr-binding forkhead associated (FHA) protein